MLADRLLNKTYSEEAETEMLEKLKIECGFNDVNKMSKMFSDMKLSEELQKEFTTLRRGNVIANVEFSSEILTKGTWPDGGAPACKIPPAMKSCTTAFENFYKNKN